MFWPNVIIQHAVSKYTTLALKVFCVSVIMMVILGFVRERQIIVQKFDHELVAVINSVPLAGDILVFRLPWHIDNLSWHLEFQ
jgi:hypothetical protein